MQRICYLLLGLVALLSISCQKEISYTNNGTGNTDPVTSTVQGNVFDENDNPAAGVTITVGTKTATTDAKGYFRIRNASLDKKTSLLTAEKTGYFKAVRLFGATKAVNHLEIKLLPKALTGTFNTTSGGEIVTANGSKVKFSANSISRANGTAYSGTVNVFATAIDPTRTDIIQTMPGSFLAQNSANEKVVLKSYAMLAVELESPSGEKLQISSNNTATLSFNIPAGLQSTAPASMPLWWLDEKTGLWKEEGTVTKNGNSYEGSVKHFTYWNCDVPGPTVGLTATFVNQNNLPLAYTSINVRPVNGYYSAHGMTDSLGQIIDVPIPQGIPLVLEVLGPCYSVIYSQNIGPFSSSVNLGTISINNSQFVVTIQGTVVNCSGNPVTNGFAMIYHDNRVVYASVNNTGSFEATYTTCGGAAPSCEVTAVDSQAGQQSAASTFTVSPPVTNVGTIIACGTSTIEFIDYTLDGVQTNLSSLNSGDTFHATDSSNGANHGLMLTGYRNNNLNIFFDLNENGNAGSFPLLNVFTATVNQWAAATPPSTVNLTSHAAAVGAFYEGNFSGQFKDASNVNHTISGTFRIRRTN